MSCFDVGTLLCSNDAWTWDGSSWTELHPVAGPTLFRSTAAYEEVSGNVVLYTFDAAGTFPTWTGDGSTWSLESSNPAPNRIRPAMTWDPALGHIVMFRGFYNTTEDLLAMWEWIGRKWTPLHVDSPVQTASGFSDRHILLGYQSPGYHGTSARMVRDRPSQTWQWDGSRWTQLSPTHDPNVFVEGMFDDPSGHRVLLVGREPYGTVQVWAWGGSDWSQLA